MRFRERTNLLIVWFQFLAFFSQAQLLSAKKEFSRYDSLLGAITPLRDYNVLHYDLDIEVNLEEKTIQGKCRMRFKTQRKMNRLQIDLHEQFHIKDISIAGVSYPFVRDGNFVFVEFRNSLEAKREYSIITQYEGSPQAAKRAPWDGGFVWSKDSAGDHWVGVACEGLGASMWWPCKDHWSDEPDNGMSIHITVPSEYTAVANGKLISRNNLGVKSRYDWQVINPINVYNVTLNIAKFENIKTEFYSLENGKTLDINYWVLREHKAKADKQFSQVIPMMLCYEARFGPYPFYEDGYQLVETPYLGMEHQSCIAYGNGYRNGYKGNLSMTNGLEFDYIIIHETGHEWFGNNITAADNADMWIHEGFTTYAESIYAECVYGAQTGIKYIENLRSRVRNQSPIQGYYHVAKEGDGDMYAKGALFIHTIRCQIDRDSLWYNILKDMHKVFFHKLTNADEILKYFNQKTGMDFTALFHHYLQKSEIPEIRCTKTNGVCTLLLSKTDKDYPLSLKVKYYQDGVLKSAILKADEAVTVPYHLDLKLVEDNYVEYIYK